MGVCACAWECLCTQVFYVHECLCVKKYVKGVFIHGCVWHV